ncbi:MAG: tetratricopeptide repeat protein [Aureispira sp.]|nr:tetratricopeptide repeat protein [Aureispira sp.]
MKYFIFLLGSFFLQPTLAQDEREPSEENAFQEDIFRAQQYFSQDSFALALFGRKDSGFNEKTFLGFEAIAVKYMKTPMANITHYYAGVCFFKIGDYINALTHLSKFKTKDATLQAVAYGLTGDVYLEQGKFKDALSYYEKASNYTKSKSISPIFLYKAALLCEIHFPETDQAKTFCAQLKKHYPIFIQNTTVQIDLIRITKEY